MANPMLSCPVCDGLVPAARASCPHCDHAVPRRPRARLARLLAQLTLGTGLAVTLMACYGMSPHYRDGYDQTGCQDNDRDGVCAPQDCNDEDPSVVPGGADPDLDGIDQNCDGADGWRDPGAIAAPAEDPVPPVEPTPIATEPTPIATDPAPPPP